MRNLTIIMYHYVRPIKNSHFPNIKGLELEGFRRQLDFLEDKFSIVSAEQVISAVKGGVTLPENSCWLTFDDGFKDNLIWVLPELKRRDIQGSFFVPAEPVIERILLDVHAIQFILASAGDLTLLVEDLSTLCLQNGIAPQQFEHLWNTYATSGRYDSREAVFTKRLLQFALPKPIRGDFIPILFERYVGVSQKSLADELYLSINDVEALVADGMYVGSHGYSHLWMNRESQDSQKSEILRSLNFLRGVGSDTSNWIMCHPYGAYNQGTIEILLELGCSVGITTEVGMANLDTHNALELPRFDTNNFPQ